MLHKMTAAGTPKAAGKQLPSPPQSAAPPHTPIPQPRPAREERRGWQTPEVRRREGAQSPADVEAEVEDGEVGREELLLWTRGALCGGEKGNGGRFNLVGGELVPAEGCEAGLDAPHPQGRHQQRAEVHPPAQCPPFHNTISHEGD